MGNRRKKLFDGRDGYDDAMTAGYGGFGGGERRE